FVEPGVFAAVAAEDAVDLHREVLDVGLPAGRSPPVGNDRPGKVCGKLAFDLPKDLLAALFIARLRLLREQLVDLGVAIAVPVEARPAAAEQVDRLGPTGLQVEADRELLAH